MELMMKSMGDISMKPDADVALGISVYNACLEPTVTDQREVGPRTSLRLVEAYSLLFSNMLQRKCLFPVYRLAVDAP